jgi:hypothetical protein
MKLKEKVYSICKNVKSELSQDSMAALVLHRISKNKYFKDNYNHFELALLGEEIRLLSTPLNEAKGVSNGRMGYQILNSDPKDYDLESFRGNSAEKESLLLDNRKAKNIKDFFCLLDKSNNFNELSELIMLSDKDMLLDLNQNLVDIFEYENEISGVKKVIHLLNNLLEVDVEDGFYAICNKKTSFGGTFARDNFDCSILESMASNIDSIEYIKKNINNGRLYSIGRLFIDEKTNEIPKEVREILEDSNIQNLTAVNLYLGKSKKYKSPLLEVAISQGITKKDKHFKIANFYFDDIKENALKSENFTNKKINSNDALLKKHKDVVDIVVERVIKEYPVLQGDLSEKHLNLKSSFISNYGDLPQIETLNDCCNFNFYSHDLFDMVSRGIEYGTRDSFESVRDKENVTFIISNKDDLVGFGNFYEQRGILRINNVNIAKSQRGNNKVEEIYEKLMEYSVEKNMPIQTSMYSTMGNQRLPNLKKKLVDKNKDILWLDTCTTSIQSDPEKLLATMNEFVLSIISKEFSSVPMREIRKEYDNQKERLVNAYSENSSWDVKHELKDIFLTGFKKNLHKLLGKKNIKNIKGISNG